MLCTDLTFVKHFDGRLRADPIRCKRWSCEYCQPWRKRRLIAMGASGNPDTFLTLTSSPQTAPTPVEAARVLVTAWRKVRLEIQKRYGYETLQFLAVFEATKRGWPHLHILLRCKWIDQAWLSSRMDHHAKAPVVDIRRVTKMQDVVRYLFKYIGKAPQGFGTCKRYWASRHYEIPKEDSEYNNRQKPLATFTVLKRFTEYCLDARLEGYSLEYNDGGVWLDWQHARPPPGVESTQESKRGR